MIDIVNFYKEKVDKWNADQKCGLCYSFGAPLFNSEVNIQQTEGCCVNVFLTNIRVRSNFNQTTDKMLGYKLIDSYILSFELNFLTQGELGVNNYNEIIGHPIEGSKWETTFKPLLNCFGCAENQCETIDGFGGYNKWEVELVHNYLDKVYNGIKVRAEIIIKK